MSTGLNMDEIFGKLNCTMCGNNDFMCDCDQDFAHEGADEYNDLEVY